MKNKTMNELEKILSSKKYNTDKNREYLDNYVRHFSKLKDSEIALLELGIYKGGSLYLWRDYFSHYATIVGLDINSVVLEDESGRIHIYKGRQQDTVLLDRIGRESAKDGFDIIIDDASHLGEATKISFWHLFEHHLKPGGIYVIEDWRTGYWGNWYDGKQFNLARHDSKIRNGLKIYLDQKLDAIVQEEDSDQNPSLEKRILTRFRNKISRKHFKNHDAGMVGFVKELVDEAGMDAITSPKRESKITQRKNKVSRIEITAGQVFVFKRE